MTDPKNCVFTLDGEAWQIRVNGRVLPFTFNSRGAAIAGLLVEQRRAARKAAKNV